MAKQTSGSSPGSQSSLYHHTQRLPWLSQNDWQSWRRWEWLKCPQASVSVSLSSQWSPIWSLVCLMVNSRTKEEKKQRGASEATLQYKLLQWLASLHSFYVSRDTLFCGKSVLYDDQRVQVCMRKKCVYIILLVPHHTITYAVYPKLQHVLKNYMKGKPLQNGMGKIVFYPQP